MTILLYVFSTLAILLHLFIFYLESFAWTTRATTVFGHSAQAGEQTRELAFNMGFYNLFLALIAAAGLFVRPWSLSAGNALVAAGIGAMLAAAVLLFATSPNKRAAAVKQGTFPLLALLALAFA